VAECWGWNFYGQAPATKSASPNITTVPPAATFNYPASVTAGMSIGLSLIAAQVPGHPEATSFTYAFDCGDGSGYGAFGAINSTACSTTTSGSRSVGGKVKDQDGDISEYTGTVEITEPTGPVFSSSCTYSISKRGDRTVHISWENAAPGVTLITIVSDSDIERQQRGPTTSGGWTAKLKSGTPTYRLDGGAKRTDTGTNLVPDGSACSLEH
jgi:hypothetical protein